MRFNNFSRLLLVFLSLGIGFFVTPSHAEMQVLDRIYLIVNSQMLTRTEAQDVAAAMKARDTSVEKTQIEHKKELLTNLLQEMLLLDRAEALKITPGEKEIASRLDRLAADQPQLLEVYEEEDLKEQISREFKKHHVISREVDSKIRIEAAEIELFCKQQLRKERKVGLAQFFCMVQLTKFSPKLRPFARHSKAELVLKNWQSNILLIPVLKAPEVNWEFLNLLTCWLKLVKLLTIWNLDKSVKLYKQI